MAVQLQRLLERHSEARGGRKAAGGPAGRTENQDRGSGFPTSRRSQREGSHQGGWSELPGRKAARRVMLGSSAVQLVLRQLAFRGNFPGGEGQVGEVQAADARVMYAC